MTLRGRAQTPRLVPISRLAPRPRLPHAFFRIGPRYAAEHHLMLGPQAPYHAGSHPRPTLRTTARRVAGCRSALAKPKGTHRLHRHHMVLGTSAAFRTLLGVQAHSPSSSSVYSFTYYRAFAYGCSTLLPVGGERRGASSPTRSPCQGGGWVGQRGPCLYQCCTYPSN
jgi:hypothetical protein